MISSIRALKRYALSSLVELNILSMSYDGKFEDFLVDTGNNIYEVDLHKGKEPYEHSTRVGLIKFTPEGNQFHINLPNHIDIDIILCNCIPQIGAAKQISRILYCPLIYVDHEGNKSQEEIVLENCDLIVTTKEGSPNYIPMIALKWKEFFTEFRKKRFVYK